MSGAAPLLQAAGVHKRFGGVHALRGAGLDVRAGEVHALVGENGAGKSTLIGVLAGAVRRDAGEVTFAGRPVDFRSPAESQAAGIAVIHQELTALPTLSVAENLLAGRLPRRGPWVDWPAARARSRALLARVGLVVDPRTPMRALGASHQQLVEVAKALGAGARLLVMDEPTASLTEGETRTLLALVRQLRDAGAAVLYVSHRLGEVFAAADRVTVFRDGAHVRTLDRADATPAAVVALMVGRAAPPAAPGTPRPLGPPVLEVRGLTRRARARDGGAGFADVSLAVRAGEVVGLAGLVGAGRSEVARAIFGADPADAGEVRLGGQPVRFRSPADAIRAGVALVPEDRKALALFAGPVRWNVSMAALPSLGRRVLGLRTLPRARERALAEEYVARLRVKTPSVEAPVGQLSGGNQQKTVVARWLAARPRLLLLDEPTHGVDVGAKAELHALVRALAAEGMAVLLIASELPELLELSDRVVVLRAGRVAAELPRADATQERLLGLMTGAH